MDGPPTGPELDIARDAARAGGRIVAEHFARGVTVREKAASDLVSDADTDSEDAIVGIIRAAFPAHDVLGEEAHRGDIDAEHLWIVDPLDGTTNFAHGVPHFAVSIAYYHRGEPQCGVVHNPVRDDWYVAARGGGAWCNDRPLAVGDQRALSDVLVGTGFYYDRGAMMECTLEAMRALFGRGIRGIRRFGTASLDLCHVAGGSFGAFFEYELAPWDFAAGRLIVEEAGGRVTTCTGERLPPARSTVLASNGHLHETMIDIVGALAPGSPA